MAQTYKPQLSASKRSANNSLKPLLRKRLESKSQNLKSKHPSSAFLSKCSEEQRKLQFKIADELRYHLLNLFESQIFADTLIVIKNKLVKRVHSSVLIARVPHLFEELLHYNQIKHKLNEDLISYYFEIPNQIEVNESQLILFLRKIYSDEDLEKEEIDLIQKLKYSFSHSILASNVTNQKMDFDLKDKEPMENAISDKTEELLMTDISDIADHSNGEELESCLKNSSDLQLSEMCKKEETVSPDLNTEVQNSNQMVRSSTFELLSSINSEVELKSIEDDKNDSLNGKKSFYLHTTADNSERPENCNQESNSSENELSLKDICVENLTIIDKQPNGSNEKLSSEMSLNNEKKASNALFPLFIDMKSISDQKSFNEYETNKEEEFKSIAQKKRSKIYYSNIQNDYESKSDHNSDCVNNETITSYKGKCNESIKAPITSLNRSLDSALEKNKKEKVYEIPLLPMSPIFRRKECTKPDNNKSINESKTLEKGVNYKLIEIKSSIEPQDVNAMTFPLKASVCLSCDSSGRNSLSNSCLMTNSKTESSSASINSLGDNDYKTDSFENDSESLYSEVSEVSSLLNINFSNKINVNSDKELSSSLINRTIKSCSKLGEDLLKMFLEEINTDITIKVNDREIKAHKCIIASRCRYFEAMLRGNWRESNSNYITLEGFSYNSVYFALYHLYSGAVSIPTDGIDLSELALLSDLLAMDSLKEVVIHELKMNYCHFFHNPCGDKCIIGVIECLSLCSRCGLKDLSDKCLNWIAKHFNKVWVHKTFASLNGQLMECCYQTKINHFSPDIILNITLDCEQLINSLPRVKWAEPVFALLAKLLEECCNYIASVMDLVITSNSFISLGRANSWRISSLEEYLLASMTKLSADVSCKSHLQLNNILLLQNNDETGFGYGPFNEDFVRLVSKMQRYCERYMIQNANAVVHCQSWSLLSNESQQRIKNAAVLVFEFEKATAPPPKLTSSIVSITKTSAKKSDSMSNQIINTQICKERSTGAVPKKITKNRSKINAINTKKFDNKTDDQHIYDSVPDESVSFSQKKFDKKIDKLDNSVNKSLKQQVLTRRKSQEKIAKVLPFSIKTSISNEKIASNPNNSGKAQNLNDLVDEIDAESNLVTHCLQEAELLEQELTRKLHKNLNSSHEKSSNSTGNSTQRTRPTSSKTRNTPTSRLKSGSLKANNVRPHFK